MSSTSARASGTDADATAVVVSGEEASKPNETSVGTRHGRYVVVDTLGRGGMGTVVRAYDPKLGREVALKLLSDERDPVARARIVREAQAMAQLSHPNVVAIYDVELDHEPPFITMEIVDGTTLRAWLREAPRSWREIVDAFAAAGEGLAAAHAVGLVHRDFKPANVLRGSDGRVRVTDFGIARLHPSRESGSLDESFEDDAAARRSNGPKPLESRPSVEALTEAGVVIGTPAYMAPEQHEGREADARSDQYAFCVALWEALGKKRPFAGGFHELLEAKRRLRLEEPAAGAIPSHIRAVLLRGLAVHPEDRFASMQALLSALRRDPSRKRRWLGAALVVAGGFAAWGTTAWLQERDAIAACERAGRAIETRWNEQTKRELERGFDGSGIPFAREQFERAIPWLDAYAQSWSEGRTNSCLAAHADPANSRRHERVVGCFEERRASFEAQLDMLGSADADVVRHAVDAAVGLPSLVPCSDEVWLSRRLGLPEDAQTRAAIGRARRDLAAARVSRTMGRYDEAARMAEAQVERAEAIGWRPLVAEALQVVGRAYSSTGELDAAIDATQRAFFEAGATGHDEISQKTAAYLSYLHGTRKTDANSGLQWSDIALMFHERMGGDDELALADTLDMRGTVYESRGDHDEAIATHRRSLEIRSRYLPPEHPLVCGSLTNLGMAHYSKGEYDEALQIHRRVLERRRSVLGDNHPDLVELYNHVGITFEVTGRYDDAFTYLRKALALGERTLGPEHPVVADIHNNLGNVYADIGDNAKSLAELQAALRISKEAHGRDSMSVGRALTNIANAYAGLERYEEALAAQQEAIAIFEPLLGPEHEFCGMLQDNMGYVLQQLGRHDEAMEKFQLGLAIREKTLGPDHPDVVRSLSNLGDAYRDRGSLDDAIAVYERALDICSHQVVAADLVADVERGLARALWDSGKDRTRALQLATSARDGYAAQGEAYATEKTGIDNWLRQHTDADSDARGDDDSDRAQR